MAADPFPDILLLTGAMAAGKTTVGQALAEHLSPSVHLRGDAFRKMIVGGRADMSPEAAPEAERQLALRYELGCIAAARYAEAGFKVIYQDILFGPHLLASVGRLQAWLPGVVVLDPAVEALATREAARGKTGYGEGWTPDRFRNLLHADTPRIGLWLDTTDLSVEETVSRILDRPEETRRGLASAEES